MVQALDGEQMRDRASIRLRDLTKPIIAAHFKHRHGVTFTAIDNARSHWEHGIAVARLACLIMKPAMITRAFTA
jgi:hypothetical protein